MNHLIFRVALFRYHLQALLSEWIKPWSEFPGVCLSFPSPTLSSCLQHVMMSTEIGICCVTSDQKHGGTVCLSPNTYGLQPSALGPSSDTCQSLSEYHLYQYLQMCNSSESCTHLWISSVPESCLLTQTYRSTPLVCGGKPHHWCYLVQKNLLWFAVFFLLYLAKMYPDNIIQKWKTHQCISDTRITHACVFL